MLGYVEMMISSGDVLMAKERLIQNWRDDDVFEEVENVGQPFVSVR